MTARLKNLEGQKFGPLDLEIVISWIGYHSGRRRHLCLCKCRCGETFKTEVSSVTGGATTSCGCFRKEIVSKRRFKHGGTAGGKRERLNVILAGMIQRCEDQNAENYKDYGGRGITVCEEWRHDYAAFREWALANGYSDELSIDRIDNNAGYFPWNCRWSTRKVQNNNKRNVKK